VDPVKNPYTPNTGSRPAALAGRDAELEQFRVLVARLKDGATEQSMIIRGLRGVGKTVLLNAFEDRAEAEGFLTYYHELTPESGLLAEVARDAQVALARLELSKRVLSGIRRALAHLSAIKVAGPERIEISLELGRADEASLSRELSDLFVALGGAARGKRRGVAFLIDEVQFADEVEFRALITALHRVTQRSLPITMAAAGLPQIPRLTGEARSYAERLFDFPVIANLDPDAARTALVDPARGREVDYREQAVELALDWTGGYPFYIQQLGKHAWNLAQRSPIDHEVIAAAIPVAQAALDSSIYQVRFQRATEAERRYMRAMAELGTGPYRSGEVARQAGKSTPALSRIRQQLLDKGLIYATEDYGHLDFTIPRFAEFMRRQVDSHKLRRKRVPKGR
jgi:AAA ATPase domain